jgi:hypothetical protein
VENIEELLDDLSIDNRSSLNLAAISQQGFLFGYNSLMVKLHTLVQTMHLVIGNLTSRM